jgi:uncharacterized membrane protein YeaQ/YmgE (transglycosylase-associated protein family)
MDDRIQALLPIALVGLLAGFLASFLIPGGGGLIRYLVSGVLGAFIGGFALSAAGIELKIRNPLAAQIATATIGAVIVLLLAKLIA